MPPDAPLNKAHQHACNAEDYIHQGLFILAAEEHYKSAEAFLRCVEQASDEATKRTLRMLYNEHNKAGKDLQRKIAEIREEGKDPSLPQRSLAPSQERSYGSPSPAVHAMLPRVLPRARMGDSTFTIDESYTVLGQQSDPMDAFNQFWNDLEGMLDNLSQPVAFASAPLAHFGAPEFVQGLRHGTDVSSDSRTIRREQHLNGGERDSQVGVTSRHDGRMIMSTQSGQVTVIQTPPKNAFPRLSLNSTIISKAQGLSDACDPEEVMADEDSPSGESFLLIPSTTKPSLATELQNENDTLRLQLTSLQEKLDIAERMRVEQEEQLRERITTARREAQRVKNSGILPTRPIPSSLDLSSLNINVSPVTQFHHLTGQRDREIQLTRRMKELEEELKNVRMENEKQKAMIIKFRERWEKLKESAKRKRNAKANAISNNVQEQRIDEETEAEVAAEDGETPDSFQA